jgi:phage-related protein
MKRLIWLGTSKDDLRALPTSARAELGTDLRWVQQGAAPRDWKPMPSIGAGVREMRVRNLDGAFRAFYVVENAGEVYVLHVFQKKSEQTATHDIRKGRARYKLIP